MEHAVSTVQLDIAEVHFRVSSETPIHLPENGGPYSSFQWAILPSPGALTLEVALEVGELPTAEGLTPIFSDRSWSLYRDTVFYHLEFRSSRPDRPLWVARFGEDAREVTVFGSEEMLQRIPTGDMVLNPVCYPLDQILLVYALARQRGLLLHAAGAIVEGLALVFPGRSGAGKTTISRTIGQAGGMRLLSDDRVVVRWLGEEFRAFGTPWPGEAGVALNDGAPLAGLLFLAHSRENRLERLSCAEALKRLIPVASIPWYNASLLDPLLALCEDLVAAVPSYELQFSLGKAPAELLREFAQHHRKP